MHVIDGVHPDVTNSPVCAGDNTYTTAALNVSTLNDSSSISITADHSDGIGNDADQATKTILKDTVIPSGYAATIDQDYIYSGNQTALSFTFTSAETGTTYHYSITSSGGGTAVTGSGTVTSASQTISGIIVSGLNDGTLTLTFYLTDTAGNRGADATDTKTKDATAPDNNCFPSDKLTGANKPVTISSSGSSTNTVWFAPAGTTVFTAGTNMTMASGIATTIQSPSDGGEYYLYVIDQFGNVSTPSTGKLTVDANPPTNQDTVFTPSRTIGKSQSVSIANSGDSTNQVWFAPAGTTTFTAGATMTKAASGTSTTILSPSAGGYYKLYIIDAAGNVSDPSTATLTVDAYPTRNQDCIFDTPITVGKSKPVTISPSGTTPCNGDFPPIDPDAGLQALSRGNSTNTVWFAPEGTTSFVANGTTITSTTGDSATITSPSTTGTYRLYVIDQYLNVSSASLAILTVDADAPTNQNLVFPSNVTDTSGTSIPIVASSATGGDSTDAVWFAPAGTTTFVAGANMTTASGDATSLAAPTTQGTYRLFVIDQYGNVSSASTAILTVDNSTIAASITGQPTGTNNVTVLGITVSGNIDTYRYKVGAASSTTCSVDVNYSTDTPKATLIQDNLTSLGVPDGLVRICVVGKKGVTEQALSSAATATWTKDTTAPTNQNLVLTGSSTVQGGTMISITASSATGGLSTDQVWLAPASTTTFVESGSMTMVSGSATSIDAPSSDGVYYLYVIDVAGNISAQSTNSVTSDTTKPTDQNTVFPTGAFKHGGTAVSIGTTSEAEVWFAPAGLTTYSQFTEGATMTKAAGSAGSILAPATAGSYRLYVIDTAHNVSDQSTAVLTVDNTAPSFTGVTPAPSANVPNANVTYTLSETSVSGTITWTWESGTTDTNSPHTYTLSGSELISGAHSLSLTFTHPLVDNALYTVQFSATDAAGNTGTSTSSGVTYNSGATTLTITSAVTMDADGNGKIDHYRITFNTNVNDSTFPGYTGANTLGSAQTAWTAAGYSGLVLSPGSQAPATDTANDNVIYLKFTEGAGYDTGAKPDLTTTATPGLKSSSNVSLAQVNTPDVVEADGANPIVVSATGTTTYDTLTVTFSEAVYGTTDRTACTSGTDGLMNAATLGYNNGYSGGATSVSGMVTGTGSDVCASDAGFNAKYTVNNVFVTGDGDGVLPDDNVYASATVYDAANNTGNISTSKNLSIVAASIPVITKIETFDSNNNGKIDQLKITFNQNMNDSTINAAAAAQFTINGVAAEDVDTITGGTSTISAPNDDPGLVNDTVVTIFTDDTTVTGTGALAIAFTTASGKWRASGGAELQSASDLSGYMVDKAPPVLMTATAHENSYVGTTDIDSDDTIVLTFSEPTNKPIFNTATISTGVDLNSVFQLSTGHTWGSSDAITSNVWNGAGNQLTVTFSGAGSTPATLAPGDTILIIGTTLKDTAPIPNTSTNIAGREPISGSFVTDTYPPYMLSVYNIRSNSITVQYSEPMLCDGTANAINTIANYTVKQDPYGTPVTLTITSIDIVSSSAVQLNFSTTLANLVMHNVAIASGHTVVDLASPTANQITTPKNLDFIVNERIKVVNAAPVTQNSVRIYFNKIPYPGNNTTTPSGNGLSAGCTTSTECNKRYKISPSLGNITQAILGTGVLANTVTITHETAQTGKAYTVMVANGDATGDPNEGFPNLATESLRNATDSEDVQLVPKDRAGFTGLGTAVDDLGDGEYFSDPFVDATAFSYTFTYGNRVYLGTNDTNKIAYRYDPAGTNAVTATFDFSTAGGTATCTLADGFGYGAASTCGTNMGYYGEKGVGGFTSATLTIGGTSYEMLLVGPLKSGIKQAYFTQDLDTILNWKQFTIFSTTGANAEAIHTMYGVDNHLYVALSCDQQNFAPQVGVQTATVSSGAISLGTAADMSIYNIKYIGKSDNKKPNPCKANNSSCIVGIDSMMKYNNYLYMANNGGIVYADNAGTPVLDDNFGTYAVSATPSAWTDTTLVIDTLSKINAGSKGVPVMKVYNGKLYAVRNIAAGGSTQTTEYRGELWVCNPATSGSSATCDPGDWTQLVFGTESELGGNGHSFSMFEINGQYAYLGVDHPSGSRVFRKKLTNSGGTFQDIQATNGTSMYYVPSSTSPWTSYVLLNASYPNVLSSTTISDGASHYIYITAGRFPALDEPIKVFRQKD